MYSEQETTTRMSSFDSKCPSLAAQQIYGRESSESNLSKQGLPIQDQSEGREAADDGEFERIHTLIKCLDYKVDVGSLTCEAMKLLQLIPEGYIPLPHLVGGHGHVDGKLGIFHRIGEKDIIFKPASGHNGPREVQFYENIFHSQLEDVPEEILTLRELVPKYWGTHDIIDRAGEIHKYIKLEDIVSRFRKPCIMDIKVGLPRKIWENFTEQEKRPPQDPEFIRFRIAGMRVYCRATGDFVHCVLNKGYGRTMANSVRDALNNFFMDGDSKRKDVLDATIERLYCFLRWMKQQKLFKFLSTSLLIVYEGDTDCPIRKPKDLLDIRLIDFAHARERNPIDGFEPDFNTLFGLQNFIKCLEQLNARGQLGD